MSLILDALRKIELERRAKRLKSPVLRSDVLHYSGAAPTSGNSRRIPLVAAAVLLLFGAAAFFLYIRRPESAPRNISSPRDAVMRESTPLVPSPPLPTLPTTQPVHKSVQPEAGTAVPTQKKSAETDTETRKTGDDGITVSGIAWQDERSLRRAVINGQLVGEGAEIAGAKIIEIKESRIRFSRGGEIFEVVHAKP